MVHYLYLERRCQGILFFAYGMEEETTAHYTREAFVSARRIKSLNPTVNITLVTNPGLKPDIAGAFDLVRNLHECAIPILLLIPGIQQL